MILRFIKVSWFFSLVGTLATLLYVYAALPEHVVYSLSDRFVGKAAIGREGFFYVALFSIAFVNFLLYALSRNLKYKLPDVNDLIRNWQLSLAVVLNIFFIVILFFVYLVNSGDKFDYDYFGYLIYVCLGLLFIWIVALPFLLVRAARLNKKQQ